MEKLSSVLLDVWQEACRHIEISQSTETIAAILARHLPIDRVVVRRIDPRRPCLETVAVGAACSDDVLSEARTECSRAEMDALLAWCKRGKAERLDRNKARGELASLLALGIEGSVLAGPLGDPAGYCGVLILAAPSERAFDARHEALMQVLLDPFSAALDNDRRLREMAALREAAEADKQSLLARLGRKELGDAIVGADGGLRAVMDRVELVARSDVPVLIFGETGTGKELLARVIHARSPRSAGPVIRVNCGAIPPQLIDSQLFGHERGAFTGAVETHRGWFERADGGTLFLDEIGELPLAAQVRLLRILQDGSLERVGSQQAIHVDVRIVAATHQDLAAMVSEGRFREDLWYRVAVFPILLPPLRERQEDIAELANHFAQRAAVRLGLRTVMPTGEDIDLLRSYSWPGNVRELATVIDRAAILGEGARLEIATALGIAGPPAPTPSNSGRPAPSPGAPSPGIVPLDTAIKQHIEAALAVTKGQIEGSRGAALLLQVNPHTLRSRMRRLGIDWQRFRGGG